MAFIDYYKILGVDRNIPQSDVRKAYLKRTKQFHPDLHPDDAKAKAKFQALTEAYEVISDPEKRKKYDQYGERWREADMFNAGGQGRDGSYFYQGQGGESPFSGFDFSSFGSSGGFSSFFEDLFGKGARTRSTHSQRRQTRADQQSTVSIDLYTALLGGEVIVQLGNGSRVRLKVPAETQDGTKVRLRGKGRDLGNGTCGDLIITYRVKLPTHLSERQKDLLRQMRDA